MFYSPASSFYSLHDFAAQFVNSAAEVTEMAARNMLALIPGPYSIFARQAAAAAEVLGDLTKTYPKPEWNLPDANPVVVATKPFCNLVHFECEGSNDKPPILLFAPMSGHYATLLRDTVKGLLPDHDVYITDWANARDMPLSAGDFGIEDYIDYAVEFMDLFGSGLDVMAVCQPGPEVLAAIAHMHERKDCRHPPPQTLTIMGSPVNTFVAPTDVTRYAQEHPIEEILLSSIQKVPAGYAGQGREVYPGWMQISRFMGMKLESHRRKFNQLYEDLIAGDHEAVERHRRFYNEYFAASDLPRKFYEETVRLVFQENALAKGLLKYKGKPVDLKAITHTAIHAIEGEKDDISAPGQTGVIIDLCSNLPAAKKHLTIIPNVGHYGLFSGKVWQDRTSRDVTNFTSAQRGAKRTSPHRPRAAVQTLDLAA
jgi:poly(3-hydroxybutyrate) depolymerase